MKKKIFDVCAFDDGKDKCRALNVKKCLGCAFYKTEADLAAARARSEQRIRELTQMDQERIRATYPDINNI